MTHRMAATVPALTRGEARLSAVNGCRFLCIRQLPSLVRSPVPRLRSMSLVLMSDLVASEQRSEQNGQGHLFSTHCAH